ncbi:MAG: glycosyltransferase family 4 protein [Polyangiaceae bacterium]|nr:glycosyltransferase family 4 protein [Polyangiaceae bacterium]
MRILAITPIWPTRLQPVRAPYNVQQFKRLARRAELRVLDAVPYMPLAGLLRLPSRSTVTAGLPATDLIEGVPTWYVRQLYVPKVGVGVAVPLTLASLTPYLEHVRWADVLLGTWAHPHGCAAVLLGRLFKKPVVVKVHGSDLNVQANLGPARAMMRGLLPRADAMVSVSRALAEVLFSLGVPRDRVVLVPNGVDEALFYPRDKGASREKLGLPREGKLIVFVGRIEPQKGTPELLEAFGRVRPKHPDARLALIGEGASRPDVDRAKAQLGDALVAPGERPFAEVPLWMGAADLVALPSWMEGTPNVLLEALASGRPCVGSDVGGIPDVLADPRSGLVHRARDAASLADALDRALAREWPAEEARACGPVSWDESADRLYEVLEGALRQRGGGAAS